MSIKDKINQQYIKSGHNSCSFIFLTNMKTRTLFAILLLLLCFNADAQQFKSQWSNRIKCGLSSTCKFLAYDSTYYYLVFFRNKKMSIEKYDNSFVKRQEKVLFRECDSKDLKAFCYIAGNIILFTSNPDDEKININVSVFDGKTLSIIKDDINVISLMGAVDTTMHYMTPLVSDSSFYFCYWGNSEDNFKNRCGYFLFDNKMNKKEHADFTFPGEALGYTPRWFFVENNRFY
jgi:hypothetical protein